MKLIYSMVVVFILLLIFIVFDSEKKEVSVYDIGVMRQTAIAENKLIVSVQKRHYEQVSKRLSPGDNDESLLGIFAKNIEVEVTESGFDNERETPFLPIDLAIDYDSVFESIRNKVIQHVCNAAADCLIQVDAFDRDYALFQVPDIHPNQYQLVRITDFENLCTVRWNPSSSGPVSSMFSQKDGVFSLFFYQSSSRDVLYSNNCQKADELQTMNLSSMLDKDVVPVDFAMFKDGFVAIEGLDQYGSIQWSGVLDLNDGSIAKIATPYLNRKFYQNYMIAYEIEEQSISIWLYDILRKSSKRFQVLFEN